MKRLENKTIDKNINEILCQIANKEDQTPYIVKNVEDGLKKRDEEIARLREENKRLREEAYKDSELQMMKSKCEAMQEELNRGFTISKDEESMINIWVMNHMRNKHQTVRYSNGQFKYEFQEFTEVEFGTIICTKCGERFNFRQF